MLLRNKNRVLLVVCIVAVSVAGWWYLSRGDVSDSISTVVVQQGDIANSTLVFGKAQPREIFNLSFDVAGTLTSYPAAESRTVSAGESIAQLDTRSIVSNIKQADSAIAVEQARLLDLQASQSQESEQLVQRSKITEIEQELSLLEQQLAQTIQNSYIQSRDIFTNSVDKFFSNIGSVSIDINIPNDLLTFTGRTHLEQQRNDVESLFVQFARYNSADDYQAARDSLDSILLFLRDFRQRTTESNNDTVSAEIATAIGVLVTARDNVLQRHKSLTDASFRLQTQQAQLQNLQAPSRDEALVLQSSVIAAKQTDLESLRVDLSQHTLRSPIAGIIYDLPLTNFQTVSAGQTVVSLVQDRPLVIKAQIAEADVAFVTLGNQAKASFDALPNQTYSVRITTVRNNENLAETIPTYETTFVFDDGQDMSDIRSGMTATVVITSQQQTNVVHIPARFIYQSDDGREFVWVQTPDGRQQQYIETGMRTNLGDTEIRSGLQAGQQVVLTR